MSAISMPHSRLGEIVHRIVWPPKKPQIYQNLRNQKKKKKRRESYENREEVDYDEPKAVDRVLSTQTSTQSVRIGDLFP